MWWLTRLALMLGFSTSSVSSYETRIRDIPTNFKQHTLPAVKRYVPLGHPAMFRCIGIDETPNVPEKSEYRVNWLLWVQEGQAYNMKTQFESHRELLVYQGNETAFYLRGMSRKLHRAIIECHQSATTTPNLVNLTSRTVLIAQTCGDGKARSLNKLNPCRYGSCHIINDHGYEILECRCLPQFTGLFCDKLATGATLYELLYYSPIFAMILVLILVACCSKYVEGVSKVHLMELEKHVPKVDGHLDMRSLFPESFLTPEKYAELAAEEAEIVEPGKRQEGPIQVGEQKMAVPKVLLKPKKPRQKKLPTTGSKRRSQPPTPIITTAATQPSPSPSAYEL
ncbi:unnamed protein product [Cylicocyclus nassatus]|uniref:EGF-like domain-containing protein n=1 Tax=Cylicocyclus nassatus TaxID=53992 RepID=A0AA36MG45_CYLNA|nr:unnamed protein product [Cylicocyclus nassatus]